jgi:enhancing lycopene biosynthesis protein 2
MGWVLRLVESGVEGPSGSVDVLEIPGDLGDLANLGLTHAVGKQLLVQQAVVAAQCRDHAAQRPACRVCGAVWVVSLGW